MARRRSRDWSYRALISAAAVLVVAGVVFLWPGGARAPSDQAPPMLAGTVSADRLEPALRPLAEPGDGRMGQDQSPPGGSGNLQESMAVATPPTTRPASTRPAPATNPLDAQGDYQAGVAAWQAGDLLAARSRLSRALQGGLVPGQAERAREALADVARRTLFTRATVAGDPLVDHYVVQQGDSLNKIAKQYAVSEDLLAEINVLPDKHFIRQGARLKVLRGPFHAVISKSAHVLDIWLGDTCVTTYRVALGANGSTPTGRWKVANRQENPGWVDPRTGERWHADDPNNPIGEYWIGLEGLEGDAVGQFGYGIHGTIEPETIGQDVSMGCVRLAPKDIAEVYRLLVPGESLVRVTD